MTSNGIRITPRACAHCGKDAFREYTLALAGGSSRTSPRTKEAWCCDNECAWAYFGEELE